MNRYEMLSAYILQMFDKIRVLVCNMFLHERRCLEQLLTCLTSEFSFVFLFDIAFTGFTQLPKAHMRLCHISTMRYVLVVTLPTVFARINAFPIQKQCNFRVKPFEPTFIY